MLETKMRKILIVISVFAALILSVISCEDRKMDEPEIYVKVSQDTIYTLTYHAHDIVNITIELVSDYTATHANKRVDVTWDDSIANLTGNATATGGQRYFVTNSHGVANGGAYARSPGDLQLDFTVRQFKNVKARKTITVLNPFVHQMIADPPVIPNDDETLSHISIHIKPPVNGQQINISRSMGTFTNEEGTPLTNFVLTTNAQGAANVWIRSAENGQGFADITADLVSYPGNPRTVEVLFDWTE